MRRPYNGHVKHNIQRFAVPKCECRVAIAVAFGARLAARRPPGRHTRRRRLRLQPARPQRRGTGASRTRQLGACCDPGANCGDANDSVSVGGTLASSTGATPTAARRRSRPCAGTTAATSAAAQVHPRRGPSDLCLHDIDALDEDQPVGREVHDDLAEPITDGDWVIAKKGARVEGVIVDSDPGARVKGVASITVALDSLTLADGRTGHGCRRHSSRVRQKPPRARTPRRSGSARELAQPSAQSRAAAKVRPSAPELVGRRHRRRARHARRSGSHPGRNARARDAAIPGDDHGAPSGVRTVAWSYCRVDSLSGWRPAGPPRPPRRRLSRQH